MRGSLSFQTHSGGPNEWFSELIEPLRRICEALRLSRHDANRPTTRAGTRPLEATGLDNTGSGFDSVRAAANLVRTFGQA